MIYKISRINRCLTVWCDLCLQAVGCTLLGVGIWLAVDSDALDMLNVASSAGLDKSVWDAAVYMSVSLGALVFLVGFLGCRGAAAKDKKSLTMVRYSKLCDV